MAGVTAALSASLALAAVSTVGDFIWATWIPEHRVVYGLMHGTVLFLTTGLVLGVLSGRPAGGALAGALIGALSAGAFYVLAPLVGFSAMFVVWFGVWIALAAVYGRLSAARLDLGSLHGVRTDTRAVVSRGVVAAIASALAFYSISGIWRPFNPQGWDYAVHFGAWTLAYLPGFAALLVSRSKV